ncbi:MAG TPA: DUF2955 domain-containing protein [Rheinheimera sp.]|nr:DUF2955 domain-containing protein [Rheinheimera sp.]
MSSSSGTTQQKLQLSSNDVRQCLRIAFGGTLGFVVCKLMGWNYGTFFAVNPMLLLGLVPVLNAHVVRQFIAGVLFVSVSVLLLQGLFGDKPGLMTLLVIVQFGFLFRCMTRGAHFLFGATTIVGLSMQLHFASYPAPLTHIGDIVMSNLMAGIFTLLVTFLMYTLFPDTAPRQRRQLPAKPLSNQRHEVILATTVATLSFIVFQSFDLIDSLSAQVASVLVLFPLNWHGAGKAGWNRAIGTLVGCNVGLAIQLLLYSHSNILLFVTLAMWISIMLFARHHMFEGGQPGAGFGAMTTMGILFGQYLTPQSDLVYSALYRFSSVAISVVCTLIAVYLMHHLLNRFSATRLQT